MKLKDIKFKDNKFDAQWLVDLHNMETGDNKSLAEFTNKYDNILPFDDDLDKGWLFEFAKWLDMGLYLDLMKVAVDSLGWDNVK